MIPYTPHPVLFEIGFIKIYSWGFMAAIAFLVGMFFAAKEAERKNINKNKIYDIFTYIIIGAIIGSRIGHIIFNPGTIQSFLDLFRIWEGGMSFQGGFIGAILFSFIYIRKNKMNFWKVADTITPSIPIAQAIGRIGCFLRGCCYGIPTSLPWGIQYLGEVRHPTQIYSSIFLLGIFFFLSKQKYKKSFNGSLFLTYIAIYSIFRFFIEFIRADPKILLNLTAAQITSVILLFVSIILFFKFKKGDKK
ncbi:MAG: prolipoprotein diacylglyceryl transferase [Candidatus Nanoarchaeia archaeon]|nr:prolipoprotein diacylglyceryl transferase [Candidatus Nanoarchaeia archaeon]